MLPLPPSWMLRRLNWEPPATAEVLSQAVFSMPSHANEHRSSNDASGELAKEKVTFTRPFNVRCPRCGAARGQPCTTKAGIDREPHEGRIAKAGGR
ncbi:zinc finger domain-containing protein [Microvirga vignae]|uniref:zinc finger domain-containing protein n=1 Tax=Microvirga vignae TaxID=1225564 RepID=UPI003CC79FDB